MIRMTQEEFDSKTFRKVRELRKGWYEVEMTCPRCGGTGHVTFSHVDNCRCWQCNETGRVTEKIQIVKRKPGPSIEEMEANYQKHRAEVIRWRTEQGYKPIDFTLKSWFKFHLNEGEYYIIKRVTEKAYLISFIDGLDSDLCTRDDWFPKSAVVFNNK